jgi:type IV pilus assembly protein PilQ
LIGTLLPSTTTTIAGVSAASTAQSALNFLTLSQAAGGSANISTFPKALNVTLNVLLQTNKAKLIANPSVVVVDDTEALITIASEVIHKVTSTTSLGVVSTNVELTKAGIFLNVLPRVSDDGFITMRLRPQVSTPLGAPQTFGSTSSPTIVTLLNVRDIMTQQVRIKDGQTLVLGGLFTENEAAQIAKFPYLAETPVLGALFRNTLKGRSRTELMLLITAKIVEDEQPQAMADAPKPLPQ